MKLITRFALATLLTGTLYALRREVFNALARSAPGTPERRNAVASLENLDAEIAARQRRQKPPTP